jgi:predicted DNA-binding transcriptional regulator YafY
MDHTRAPALDEVGQNMAVKAESADAGSFPRGRRASKGAADPAVVRAGRLFEIVRQVAAQRVGRPALTRARLAELCRCDVRTITRDLGLLRSQGAVDFDPERRTYFVPDRALESLATSGGKPPTGPGRLTLPDAFALALARGALAATGVPHRDAILAALDKATAGLPPKLAALFAQASAPVGTGSLPRDYSGVPVTALLDAATARRTVRIDYHSYRSGERRWRRVDPYEVAPRQGVFWELHAFCHDNRRILTFALDRVFGVETTDAAFERDEDAWATFTAGADGAVGGLRGAASVAVDVRFAPEVATYARSHRWPASLAASDEPDGAVRLAGTVGHVDATVAELLRWRRHVRVLGGPELRAAYRAEVVAMLAEQQKI